MRLPSKWGYSSNDKAFGDAAQMIKPWGCSSNGQRTKKTSEQQVGSIDILVLTLFDHDRALTLFVLTTMRVGGTNVDGPYLTTAKQAEHNAQWI